MTTYDDTGKLTPASREELLAVRAKLEQLAKDLRAQPQAKSEAGRRLDQQRLLDVAKKIVFIDRKLGRST